MANCLISKGEIEERLDEIVKNENLDHSLRCLIWHNTGIYINNRSAQIQFQQYASRRGYEPYHYCYELISLARLDKKLERLKHGITPLRDRGYGGATYCTIEGSYSLVATVTTKGLRG